MPTPAYPNIDAILAIPSSQLSSDGKKWQEEIRELKKNIQDESILPEGHYKKYSGGKMVDATYKNVKQYQDAYLNLAKYAVPRPTDVKFTGTVDNTGKTILDDFSGKSMSILEMKERLGMHSGTYPSETGWEYVEEFNSYFNFNRHYTLFPNNELGTLKQYCFMVRPATNILDSAESDPKNNKMVLNPTFSHDPHMMEMITNHRNLVKSLTLGSPSYTDHDFIPFLQGRTESCSIPEISLANDALSQPYTNYLMPYGGNTISSTTGGTFTMSFREDRYLRVTKFFELWLYYINGVKINKFRPNLFYLSHNKADYASSLYYFVCDPTGEKIIYWAKYTGIFPLNVPTNTFGFNRGNPFSSPTVIDIQFSYFMFEHLLPEILVDFNLNAGYRQNMKNTTYIKSLMADAAPAYDSFVMGSGKPIVGAPFVVWGNVNDGTAKNKGMVLTGYPELKWRNKVRTGE